MSTKTCKNCGWEYPLITPYATCRFCGRAFTEGICSKCGQHSTDIIPATRLCRECYNKRNGEYCKKRVRSTDDRQKSYRRWCAEADERFAAWRDKLSKLKVTTLTESEWLEACSYFKGCALCDSEQIDARGYFIRFEDGGKYNRCNVIPLCDKCATDLKYQSNPFRQMNPYINRNLATSRGLSLAKLEKAAEYLHSKMEDIVDEQQG